MCFIISSLFFILFTSIPLLIFDHIIYLHFHETERSHFKNKHLLRCFTLFFSGYNNPVNACFLQYLTQLSGANLLSN